MSDTPSPPSESERREAAATWLVQLQADAASEADWLGFEAWLADPKNRSALAAVESVVAELDAHADQISASLRAHSAASRRPLLSPARTSWKWAAGLTFAAAAAAAFFLGPRLIPTQTQDLVYRAPATAVRLVTLPDGSTAQLNRGASISIAWSPAERRLQLTNGEAAFSVVHDPARPFVVVTGDATIRDVGTEFNVLRRADSLTVTVRKGAVEIEAAGARPVAVSPGDAFRIDTQAHRATLSRSNPDDAFAWQDGRLVYHDARLAVILDDLNRYSETPIRLADPALGELRFSGALVIQPSAGLVAQLQAFLPVRSELSKGEILLRGR